jgi:hypothetical protein
LSAKSFNKLKNDQNMKYLKIQNDGELDIRLVALMGGTTKANDKYKIGQFGTGLKYTMAYLLRNNVDFKIFCGETEAKITAEKEVIKETEFEIIYIDGTRTSITTGMGQQWSPWMIIRELWCNALDEGGELRETVYESGLIGHAGKTTFYIQMLPDIQDVLDKWRQYFIQDRTPMWEDSEYAIHANGKDDNLKIYKQGVLIYQHPTPSLFSYDIKSADINELREFRGIVSMEIFRALRSPNNEVVTHFLNNITEDMYEGSELEYDWFTSFANIWKETIDTRRIAQSGDSSYYSERGTSIDFSNVIELPKRVYKALVKSFNGIGALIMTDSNTEFFESPCPDVANKINESIKILADAGYPMNPSVTISYGVFRETNQTHASDRQLKKILISEAAKQLSVANIVNILVEENEYLQTNMRKDSLAYARHFVGLLVSKIIPVLEPAPIIEEREIVDEPILPF